MIGWRTRPTRREVWGTVLIIAAAFCAWAYQVIYEEYRAGAREKLLLYVGFPGHSIAFWFLVVSILCGAVGLSVLLPALIGRIPRKIPRRVAGWAAGVAGVACVPYFGLMLLFAGLGAFGVTDTKKNTAADGQSVLVTQDGFDGDAVDIYTEYDAYHYKWIRSAPEFSGGPRVKDQHCQLNDAITGLQLTCGVHTLVLDSTKK
jgi:hypothetical protein